MKIFASEPKNFFLKNWTYLFELFSVLHFSAVWRMEAKEGHNPKRSVTVARISEWLFRIGSQVSPDCTLESGCSWTSATHLIHSKNEDHQECFWRWQLFLVLDSSSGEHFQVSLNTSRVFILVRKNCKKLIYHFTNISANCNLASKSWVGHKWPRMVSIIYSCTACGDRRNGEHINGGNRALGGHDFRKEIHMRNVLLDLNCLNCSQRTGRSGLFSEKKTRSCLFKFCLYFRHIESWQLEKHVRDIKTPYQCV